MISKSLWAWCVFACLWCTGSAFADTANDEAARQHFQSGRAYFERAEYDDAVREFEQAYRLSNRAPLLINISKAHESAGRPAEAASALDRWLDTAPADDPMRADVETRLKRLSAQTEKLRASAQPAQNASSPPSNGVTTSPSESPAESHSTVAPWLLIGVGGATLATGAVMIVLGRSDISAVESPGDDTRWTDVEEQADRGPRRVGIGIALAGVGTAALGIGLGWLFIGKKAPAESQARLELTPYGARVRGRF